MRSRVPGPLPSSGMEKKKKLAGREFEDLLTVSKLRVIRKVTQTSETEGSCLLSGASGLRSLGMGLSVFRRPVAEKD